MQIPDNEIMCKVTTLISFSGDPKLTLGEISMIIFVDGINTAMKFQVIDAPSTYNVIIGRPWIHPIKGVASIFHQLIKFPTAGEFDQFATNN